VKTRVPAGTAADQLAAAVREEQVPAKVVAEGAIADLAQVKGLVADVDLLVGEQVTTGRFVQPDAFSPTRRAVEIPDGLLELTISLSSERTIGGVLEPGDTVAVVGSVSTGAGLETRLILHKILVTNVQGAPLPTATTTTVADGTVSNVNSPRAEAPGGNLFITLAIDPLAAEKVVNIVEQGSLYLALETPDDPDAPLPIQSGDSALQ
jgi:pilus assembly protein CpaB